MAAHWAMTLAEPLLSPATRARLETGMEMCSLTHPEWATVFFGGVLADMALTLPPDDPWRHLSARIGELTVGPNPPPDLGAAAPDGTPFGTWADGIDRVPMTFGDVDSDSGLAALVEPLDPAGSAVLALACSTQTKNWVQVVTATKHLLLALADTADAAPDPVSTITRWHLAVTSATRWAIWRRRSYGLPNDDPWPIESCFRWSWQADRVLAGLPLDEHRIAADIRSESISER